MVGHRRNGYEPLFFDANLSFAGKVAMWRTQPAASNCGAGVTRFLTQA